MTPAPANIAIVTLHIVAILALAVAYFRRVRVERPPIGTFNARDLAVMGTVVVLLPPLYLRLPPAVVGTILALVFLSALNLTLAPLLPRRWPLLVAGALVAADVALARLGGAGGAPHPAFVALNNALLVVALVGISNLYAQSGMRARDVASFAFALALYDLVATAFMPLMVQFFNQLVGLPFMPILWWGDAQTGVAVGLGDLLIVALWTLVAWKGFGRAAGAVAAAISLATILAIFAGFATGLLTEAVPAMVPLGPLIALQYLFWRRRGPERTVAAYQGSAPAPVASGDPAGDALAWLHAHRAALSEQYGGQYLAVWQGEVLGAGSFAGDARRAARLARPDVTPLIVYLSAARPRPPETPRGSLLPQPPPSSPPVPHNGGNGSLATLDRLQEGRGQPQPG